MITTFDMASGEMEVVMQEPQEQDVVVVQKCQPDLQLMPRLMTVAEAVEMERRQRR